MFTGIIKYGSKYLNVFVIICLTLISLSIILTKINFSSAPYEDAAMLMHYSENVAKGHGIVYNIGGEKVDGATDFLSMLIVAFLIKIGLSVEIATRWLIIFSHIITVIIIYLIIIKRYCKKISIAIIASLFYAVGPGLAFISSYFLTPLFALSCMINWILAEKLLEVEYDRTNSIIFSFSCLISGLIRPEGVFLSIIILISLIYYRGVKDSIKYIFDFILIFSILGGIYFAWRWIYFGYPLPNPYYIKGGGYLFLGNIKTSFDAIIKFSLPFIPIYILGVVFNITRRMTIFSLITIIGFLSIWIFISGDTNYEYRFQYPFLAICILASANIFNRLVKIIQYLVEKILLYGRDVKEYIGYYNLIFTVVIIFALFSNQIKIYKGINQKRDGRYDLAIVLKQYSASNYVMAVSEAGLLPLYSKWNAIDTWGLNDKSIAHFGLSNDYLDKYKPELIMFHAYHVFINGKYVIRSNSKWDKMAIILNDYAKSRNYTLAAIYGYAPTDVHYYYVKNNFKDSENIVNIIKNYNYYLMNNENASFNYYSLGEQPNNRTQY